MIDCYHKSVEERTGYLMGLENGISIWRRLKLNSCIISHIKINFRSIKSLNVRGKIIKLLEETVEFFVTDLGVSKEFL